MNMEILLDHINTFTREVVDSGFKRDLDDYAASLPASQSNIVALRDIAGKIIVVIDRLYSSDLPEALKSLLPGGSIRPFTNEPYNTELQNLINNTEIPLPDFFNQLNQFILRLKKQIQQNIAETTRIRDFIIPYISTEVERIAKDDIAIVAIVFNEQQTITNLKQFTKTINAWNRVLPVYYALLKSESPEDVQIVEIQNGSIDFIVNLNVDVALNLADLFRLGFEVFAAYLAYKKMIQPIVESYHGNKDLINMEKDREKLLIANIGTSIQREIESQHKRARESDANVDDTAIAKKVEQVANLITSHIVRGNDLKLLALPGNRETKESTETNPNEKDALRSQSLAARSKLRAIPVEAQQKLLETYGKLKDEKE